MRDKGVLSQTLLTASSSAAAQGFTAIAYILAARALLPAEFGLVTLSIAAGMTLSGLADFGISYYCGRELARRVMPIDEVLGRLFWRSLITVALCLPVVAILDLIAVPLVPEAFALTVATQTLAQSVSVPLRGVNLVYVAAIVTMLERAGFLGIACLLVAAGVDPGTSLWVSLAAAALIASIVAFALFPQRCRPTSVGAVLAFRNPWRGTRHFGVFSTATVGATLDITVLARAAGTPAAGEYGAVSRWIAPLNLLSASLSGALLPVVSRGDRHGGRNAFRAALSIFVVGAAAAVALAVAADPLTDLLLGARYEASGEVLRLLCYAAILGLVGQPLGMLLIARGLEMRVARATFAGVGLQLTYVAAAAPSLGAVAAAQGVIVGQAVMVLLYASQLPTLRRHQQMSRP